MTNKDLELMQHFDGELDEREAAEERSRIERDADARTKVESLGQLTELVRGHLELSADAVPERKFSAMWREIGKHLDDEARVLFRAEPAQKGDQARSARGSKRSQCRRSTCAIASLKAVTCVRAQTSAGTAAKSCTKPLSGIALTQWMRAPASSAAPS